MFPDSSKHLAVYEGVGRGVDQFQLQSAWLRDQVHVEVGVRFHQGLAVVGFYTGVKDRQGTLAEQSVQAALASVLEAVNLIVGEDFKAAFWRYQSIDGGFLHERKNS